MRWFGEYWDAPVCDTGEHAETPLGAECAWCTELIDEDDRGFLIPVMAAWGEEGPVEVHHLAHHRECWARSTMGSVAHMERRCSCFIAGAEDDDPPDLSLRDAAKAVWLAVTGTNA